MNISIHSSELNRIMKTISQCIDTRELTNKNNICITHEDNKLSIRATNGVFAADMSTPVLGGDGESFCVDGSMFARVCAMCNGEITISTDEKTCLIKGVGRTKLPLINAEVPKFDRPDGQSVTLTGENLTRCYGSVAYAVSTDQGRIQLTGILTESDGSSLKMVALDGFQMSIEETVCNGDAIKVTIPGAFMKLVASSVSGGEEVTITVNGHAVQAETEGMLLKAGLLTGEYPDYDRILPKEFKTKSRIRADALRDILKAGSVVNNKQNLIKLNITENSITVQNNAEQADFEAELPCATQGDGLKIAFNQKYLMNTISALAVEDAEMNFNTSTTPVIVRTIGGKGIRLVLPVRLQ